MAIIRDSHPDEYYVIPGLHSPTINAIVEVVEKIVADKLEVFTTKEDISTDMLIQVSASVEEMKRILKSHTAQLDALSSRIKAIENKK